MNEQSDRRHSIIQRFDQGEAALSRAEHAYSRLVGPRTPQDHFLSALARIPGMRDRIYGGPMAYVREALRGAILDLDDGMREIVDEARPKLLRRNNIIQMIEGVISAEDVDQRQNLAKQLDQYVMAEADQQLDLGDTSEVDEFLGLLEPEKTAETQAVEQEQILNHAQRSLASLDPVLAVSRLEAAAAKALRDRLRREFQINLEIGDLTDANYRTAKAAERSIQAGKDSSKALLQTLRDSVKTANRIKEILSKDSALIDAGDLAELAKIQQEANQLMGPVINDPVKQLEKPSE